MNVMVGQYLLGETGRALCSGLFVKPVQLQNLERETSKTVLCCTLLLCFAGQLSRKCQSMAPVSVTI